MVPVAPVEPMRAESGALAVWAARPVGWRYSPLVVPAASVARVSPAGLAAPGARRALFGASVAALVLTAFAVRYIRNHKFSNPYFFLGCGAFLVGQIVWILDSMGIVCVPTSPFQGHAFWHFACAVALWLIYWFYRVEADHHTFVALHARDED